MPPGRDREGGAPNLKRAQLEHYARNRAQAIPAAGAELIGYFAPREGSTSTACGVYDVPGLAAHEAYRARLAASEFGRQDYAFAEVERFIPREKRIFLRNASPPHAEGGAR